MLEALGLFTSRSQTYAVASGSSNSIHPKSYPGLLVSLACFPFSSIFTSLSFLSSLLMPFFFAIPSFYFSFCFLIKYKHFSVPSSPHPVSIKHWLKYQLLSFCHPFSKLYIKSPQPHHNTPTLSCHRGWETWLIDSYKSMEFYLLLEPF